MTNRPKLLAVAPYCDGTDVGEARCAFQWIKHLSARVDITLLTQHRAGRPHVGDQLPGIRVIARSEPKWALATGRLNAMAKLSYPGFSRWAHMMAKQLIKDGSEFDLGHQFTPIALRYASPLQGLDLPYVLGPQGGSLETPQGFRAECDSDAWYMRLRGLDRWRLKIDPYLRQSYQSAAHIVGVAPYVRDLLPESAQDRFSVMSELGTDTVAQRPRAYHDLAQRPINILHVGRGVRSKGLRDAVHALALLKDKLDFRFTSAGSGPEIDRCVRLADTLGIADRCRFLGQVPRGDVNDLYTSADIFLFPSFREPSGSVVYEALSQALPVITADRGGPGHVITKACGRKVSAHTPLQFQRDLALTIATLAADPATLVRLSAGALERMRATAIWPRKIDTLLKLYARISGDTAHLTTERIAS